MFAKPKAVKLSDGTPLTNLLTATTPTTVTKPAATKPAGTQPKPATTPTTKAPIGAKKPVQQENKLSNDLK